MNFQMFKLVLEKAEEPEIKLPTSAESSKTQAQPGEEWLQVDLGAPKTVKGVIIQGARGGDSITAVEARAFVRKFKVSYSLSGKDWEHIQDPRTQQPKVGCSQKTP